MNAIKSWLWLLTVITLSPLGGARADDGIFAELQTTLGTITVTLEYERAPVAVANFIGLIEGANPWVDPRNQRVVTNRFYDGILFHRVISNFMIQAGSPMATGSDGPGYTIPDEFHPALHHDAPGVLSMANSGPHSSGGQFFITVTNTPWLNNVHTIFGRVISGMDTVYTIAQTPIGAGNRPLTDVIITNILITRVGPAAEAFSAAHPALPQVEAIGLIPTLTATGIAVIAGVENRQQAVTVTSTNLITWTRHRDHYRTTGDGSWTSAAPDHPVAFITGHRITYATDTNVPETISDRVLDVTFPVNRFQIAPRAPLSGTIQLNASTNSPLTYWEWARRPWQANMLILSQDYIPLRFDFFFDTPHAGRTKGYLYSSGFWSPIEGGAIGTFTNRPAPP